MAEDCKDGIIYNGQWSDAAADDGDSGDVDDNEDDSIMNKSLQLCLYFWIDWR